MMDEQNNTRLTLRQKLLIGFALLFLLSAIMLLVVKVVWLISVFTR